MVFGCDSFGIVDIELWAFDQSGLSHVCTTTVDIQDGPGRVPKQSGNYRNNNR